MRWIAVAAASVTMCGFAFAGDQIYRDSEYDFQIAFPASWQGKSGISEDIRLTMTSEQGGGQTSCNVIVEPVAELEGLSQPVINQVLINGQIDELLGAVMDALPGANVIETRKGLFGGRIGGVVLSELVPDPQEPANGMKFISLAVFSSVGLHQVLCGTPIQAFDDKRATLVAIISSLAFDD